MTLVNGFGEWKYLGKIQSLTNSWQVFPFFPESKNSSFWLIQTGTMNLIPKLQLRGYLRAFYFDGVRYLFDQKWTRFWVSEEPQIVQIPYPGDLIRDPLPQRQIEAKFTDRRRPGQILPEFTWSLDLYEKVDTLKVYPGDPYPAIIEEQS